MPSPDWGEPTATPSTAAVAPGRSSPQTSAQSGPHNLRVLGPQRFCAGLRRACQRRIVTVSGPLCASAEDRHLFVPHPVLHVERRGMDQAVTLRLDNRTGPHGEHRLPDDRRPRQRNQGGDRPRDEGGRQAS